MKPYLIKLQENFEKCLKKARKEFRKTMGKKTLKIDGLQFFKLQLFKAQISRKLGKTITYGDAIEILCELYTEDQLKNGKK